MKSINKNDPAPIDQHPEVLKQVLVSPEARISA
jgi:hypothetical protein